MYGGDKIVEATWILCKEIFDKEKYPVNWARGLIFLIFKGGPNEDKYNPLKYRGITLLSVLGKLYTFILNDRVTKWIESKGILVEEQAGFNSVTYVCFIDIQKAYDRVWRDGLWEKLHDYGIRGKMWRVLRSIYENVESSVLVNETRTRFFKIDTGLRQGCLLSPILFALYINGLTEEIKKENLGIKLKRYGKLGTLMFADDIALIAESKEQLEKIMEITYQYSLKWRFTFNYDKCAIRTHLIY